MSDDPFKESLMTHDWPEHGPGSIGVEELYQLFKQRYDREKELERHAPDCWLRADGDECSCPDPF
jgi:hypothetical protein